jgi:hypothetical protein
MYPEMTSSKLDHPFQTWEQVRGMVASAIDDPKRSEECESLVSSLGPQYEEDPDLINGTLLAECDVEQLSCAVGFADGSPAVG